MAQIFVAREPEQQARSAVAPGKLKVGQISASTGVEPVLFLGEVVVGDTGAVQLAQRGFRK
jgi:hypothetical protein